VPKKSYPIPRLDLGLNTVDPPTHLPPGSLRKADNVISSDGTLRQSPGYVRVGTTAAGAPRDHAYVLDGLNQYMLAPVESTTTNLELRTSSDDWTVEVVFRFDAFPVDEEDDVSSSPLAAIVYKGGGNVKGTAFEDLDCDWGFFLYASGFDYHLAFFIRSSDDTTDTGIFNTLELRPGTSYHAVAKFDAAPSPSISLYCHEVGTSLPTAVNTTSPGSAPKNRATDAYIGATPLIHTTTTIASSATVSAAGNTYTKDSGTWAVTPSVGQQIDVSGFSGATNKNNGRKTVTAATTTTITVLEGLETDVSDPGVTITQIDRLNGDHLQFTLRGVVQELRIWNDLRTTQELEDFDDVQLTDAAAAADSSLTYYQRFTGSDVDDTYFFTSVKGTAGTGTGQSPRFMLEPRHATWRKTGHTLGNPFSGNGSLDFNGRLHGIQIGNSYLYRKAITNDDGAYAIPDKLFVGLRFSVRKLVDRAVLIHSAHAQDDAWMSAEPDPGSLDSLSTYLIDEGDNSRAQFMIMIATDDGGATYQVKTAVWQASSTGTSWWISRAVSNLAGGILTNTEYVVSLTIDTGGLRSTHVRLGTPGADVTNDNSSTLIDSHNVYAIPDDPVGANRKYALSVGRPIWQIRQNLSLPGDPGGVEIEYGGFGANAKTFAFNGEIRALFIGAMSTDHSSTSLLDSVFHEFFKGNELTLGNLASLGIQPLSFWPMDETIGEQASDIGFSRNAITLQEDPDHVWARSLIATNSFSAIKALLDHRYVLPAGEQRKVIAIAGGSAYELNTTTGALTLVADGFRNDDQNLVSWMPYKDSKILCAGRGARGNYILWRDQMWRLDIAPPSGVIPFGLTDQRNKEAKLRPGVYRITFTFYSAYTGVESPIGPIIQFEIKKGPANLALGDQAEMNQTYPTTGVSVNQGPFNLKTTDANASGFRVSVWIGPLGNKLTTDPDWWESQPGGTPNPAKYKRVKFQVDEGGSAPVTDPFIDDIEDVTSEEVQAVIEARAKKTFVEMSANDYLELKGRWAGSDVRMRVADLEATPSVPNVVGAGGKIDWDVTLAGESFSGTGDKNHGIALPRSSDPQVTHLRMYRTLANDATFRLAEEVPNGTTGFIHYVDDEQLVGRILDITSGPPPAVELVKEFQGRAIFARDPLQPQRLYFSDVGEPWNVPAENVLDILDGDTLAITGMARTEGSLILWKDDTSFVAHPSTSQLLPFELETRLRDIGCVALHSPVTVDEMVYFASEKGLYRFDSAYPTYVSRAIETSWQDDVSAANRKKIVTVHDRRNDLWIVSFPTGSTTVSGAVVNDAAFVFNYLVGAGEDGNFYGWSKLTGIHAAVFAIIPDANEVDRVYFADPLGYVYRWDSGTNFGPGTLTTTGLTVVSGTSTTVTVPKANAALTDGYRGLFVTLVRVTGATRETRLVTADDKASPNSALTVDRAWTGANPASGDALIIGSIETDAISGEISPAGPHQLCEWTETFLRATKQTTTGTYVLQYQALGGVNNSHNEQTPSFSSLVTAQQVTLSNQKEDMYFSTEAGRGRRLAFRILAQPTASATDKPFQLRDATLSFEVVESGERNPVT
jgi:hypothetical protein